MKLNKRLMGQWLGSAADLTMEIPDELAKCKVNFIQGDFPSQVTVQPTPGIEGDFCDTNPRWSYDAGPGGCIAGANGVTVGRFAWATMQVPDQNYAPAYVNNFGSGPPTGFIHREQQALITNYLQSSGMLIPAGFPVTIMTGGGFWVKNNGTTTALPGQYAFANFANGAAIFGVGGTIGVSSLNGATLNGSIGPVSITINGSINGNILTTSGTASGFIPAGAALSSGTAIPAGVTIVGQLSGVTGSAGGATYALSQGELSFASGTITATYSLLTTGTVTGGPLAVGDILTASGTALTANTQITQFATGAGLAGTYYLNNSQTNVGPNMSVQLNVQTKFLCYSQAKPGEVCKISERSLG